MKEERNNRSHRPHQNRNGQSRNGEGRNSQRRNSNQSRGFIFKNYKFAMIDKDEKIMLLVSQLRKRNQKSVIIFCNQQKSALELDAWLKSMHFNTMVLAGKRSPDALKQMQNDFEQNPGSILIVEDYHTKSLKDVKAQIVIHYEVARKTFDFKPRTWFVEGKSIDEGIFFCAFEDCASLDRITDFLKTKIEKMDLEDSDFDEGITPKPEIEFKLDEMPRRDRDSQRDDRGKREPREDRKPREAREPREPRKKREEKDGNKKPVSEKTRSENNMKLKELIIESTDRNIARQRAILHFKLKDEELLDERILEEGKKKFIFFGSQNIKYRYRIKPFYRKILLPFYDDLFKRMDLKLKTRISYKQPQLRVFFSGEDAEALMKNRFELKNSIELVSKLFLGQKLVLSRDLELRFRVDKDREIDEVGLKKLVDKAIESILESKEDYLLKPLNPAERRICHQAISEDDRFESESIGDGRMKKIKISLS